MQNIKIERIIRSGRKTVALEITPDLKLIIRAPYHLPSSEIDRIVLRKREWISKTIRKIILVQKREGYIYPQKTFTDGEKFKLFGRTYKLRIIDSTGNRVNITDKTINLYTNSKKEAKDIIVNWYKNILREYINARVEFFSKKTGLVPGKIRITSARRRWGSCSVKNNLNFSWRLAMAPKDIIDYVIIHELVHIKIKNHSKKFWDFVGIIVPDYRAKRNWLKENGFTMNIE